MSTLIDRLAGVSDGLGHKAPAMCASTGPLVLSGLQMVDGFQQVEGPKGRTLVKDQTNPVENGLYDPSSGPWTRCLDFNGARDAVNGTQVVVAGGSQVGAVFQAWFDPPFIIGQSGITFRPANGVVSTAPWTAYTPVVTAAVGALDAYTSSARYVIEGKRLHISLNIRIPANGVGTADGPLRVALPPGVVIAGFCVGWGRDNAAGGGEMLQAFGGGGDTQLLIYVYDNTSPARNGADLYLGVTTEIV
ncbi:hypothetical protein [Methylobacterium iners]|uniref:Tail fiber protein n=1 Tax=Methylobacterium iners TaxID=418707 RepID=A0ABQ4RTE6_9HYPH|nr:hypothetical protein [Methylobacterium iners]GJD92943.1 hypothetical protein OCOJLMKI_0126 [Methylobacterium iners]